MSNYFEKANFDAADTAENFIDELVESLLENGEINDDMNNYSESHHHENHVDKAYTLTEAAKLLDQLSPYEETDSGLWDGQLARQAISTMAAFTYGNAVYQMWIELIREINEDDYIVTFYEDYLNVEEKVWEEWDVTVNENPANEEGPFDVEEEVERRKECVKTLIKNRMQEIIKESRK